MQLTIRIDDHNYLSISTKLEGPDPSQPENGPEVVAAVVTDSKLSDLEAPQLLDIVGQVVDHLTTVQQPPVPSDENDWRMAFRAGKTFD